jgi:soluble lytic murein transglycosylase-like protein
MSATAEVTARDSMHRNFKSRLIVPASLFVSAWVCLAAVSVRGAEIVLVDDGQGHKVYVNLDDTKASRRPPTFASRPVTPPPEIDKLVNQTADHYKVDPQLVRAIIQVESHYDTHAVSSKGAMGLMQLIPATAERFGVDKPFDAKQNIDGGVNYLKHLLDMFDGDVTLSVAAYNAGENTVLRRGGVPPITETVNYVQKIKSLYEPGSQASPAMTRTKPAEKVTIVKYVDAAGVVHYTDGSDL